MEYPYEHASGRERERKRDMEVEMEEERRKPECVISQYQRWHPLSLLCSVHWKGVTRFSLHSRAEGHTSVGTRRQGPLGAVVRALCHAIHCPPRGQGKLLKVSIT